MKRKKLIIVISLCILLGIFAYEIYDGLNGVQSVVGYTTAENYAGVVVPAKENEGFTFDIKGYGRYDYVYLFMPSRADLTKVTYYSVDKDGRYLERFMTDFTLGQGKIGELKIIAMKSSLPAVSIWTDDRYGTMEEVETSENHSVYAYGNMSVEVPDEMAEAHNWERQYISTENDSETQGTMHVRGMGNITWEEDKKSFQINTEKRIDLLGMKPGKKWALVANATDYSLLRNQVFLECAADMGLAYTPEIRQIDLYINGDYRGVYSLCSKVEADKARVPIDESRDYLFRWGMMGKEYSFPLISTSIQNKDFRIANVESNVDEERLKSAAKIAQNVLTAIEDTDTDEFLQYIDLESFAKYYWIQEFSKTTDPIARSVYSYWIEDEKKMYMGPAWDYDRTAGAIEPFQPEHDYLWPEDYTARYEGWYVPLFCHKEFRDEVRRVYQEGGVKEAIQESYQKMPGRISEITPSANMNFIRWDVLTIPQNNKIEATTFEGQTQWLTKWLNMRADWLDGQMKMESQE